LIKRLKSEGIGIFLISHDIHDVFDLSDRINVMHTGSLVGCVNKSEVSKDDVLAMIIMGKTPEEITATDIEGLHS
jgi:D-xylose transport system ATP-binding protein